MFETDGIDLVSDALFPMRGHVDEQTLDFNIVHTIANRLIERFVVDLRVF